MVEGVVEYIEFKICSIILTTGLFSEIPSYVIESVFALCFLLLIGTFLLIYYALYRKYNTINKYLKWKYKKDNANMDTYKEEKSDYEKEVSDLGAELLPNKQTIINIMDKIGELRDEK